MKTKYFLTIFLALVLVATLGWSAGNAMAGSICDAEFVEKAGNVLTVVPNGTDDTVNIQCAFDAAVADVA